MFHDRTDPWYRPANAPEWLVILATLTLAALLLGLAVDKQPVPEPAPTSAQMEELRQQLQDLQRQSDDLGRRIQEDLRLLQYRQRMREEAEANGGDPAWVDYAWGVAADYGVDPRWYLALVSHESGWRNITSSNSDRSVDSGPAQVNSGTWPYIARALGLTDPMDPEQNLRAGAYWFALCVRQQNGDYERALGQYNRGEAGLQTWIASRGTARTPYSEAVRARMANS